MLKDVYGIISFEQQNIKISVFNVERQAKHCLYFKNIYLHDTIQRHLEQNRDNLLLHLKQELNKVDTFVGVKVVRYLILVPHLQMIINNKQSDDITSSSRSQLEEFINLLPVNDQYVCLNRWITDYVVNEQVISTFPSDTNFKVNYIEYLAKQEDVKDIIDLINALYIEPLGFYNNAIAYKNSILDHKEKTRMLIEMLDESTIVYFYDENTELYRMVNINEGKNTFVNKIIAATKLSRNEVLNIIASFKNIKNINQNAVVCNYHKNNYKSLQQLDLNSLKIIVNNEINSYFKLIVDTCQKINAESIHFNCDIDLFDCFDFKLNGSNPITINRVKVEMQQSNIIGLENENVNNISWILNGVINEKEILGKEVLCSIDVNDGIINKQENKNVFMKFGTFLSNFVSKLGGRSDLIWKKS